MKSTTQQQARVLIQALSECGDVTAIIDDHTLLVRDFTCYEGGGYIVKVDNEEPDGIYNQYVDLDELERDLAQVVPGYAPGMQVWREAPEDNWEW